MEVEYERLFRSYYSVMLAAAFNRLNNLADAEDVVAEVFTAAWRRRGEESVLTLPWLYSTLRNHVGNAYRRRKREVQREFHLQDARSTEETHTEQIEECAELRRVVAQLAVGDRELIWMAYWEDLTGAEIAEILGCTHSAVRVRLLRAKKRLKSLIQSSRINAGEDARDI